jgi:hypothetical protein
VVGGGTHGECGVGAEAVDGEGRVVEGGEAGGKAGPPGVVAVFVPPPIFAEVQAVFDPPVVPHVPQEVRGRHAVGVEAGDEVADVVRHEFAGARSDLAIDADR